MHSPATRSLSRRTFKYDVMKTLKQKPEGQLQRRRTVRQRILNRSEGGGKANELVVELDGKGGASVSPPGPVASDDVMAGAVSDAGSQSSRRSIRRGHRRPFSADDSSSSVSSLLEHSGTGPSQGTSVSNGEAAKPPSELSPTSPGAAERSATLAHNTAAAAESPLISHKTALKAKRRLRDIVDKVKGHREERDEHNPTAPRRKDTSTPSPATPIDVPARSPFAFNGLSEEAQSGLVRRSSIRPSVSSPQLAARASLERTSTSSLESHVACPGSADDAPYAPPEGSATVGRRRTHRRRSSAGDAAVPSSIGTDGSCAQTPGTTREIEVEVQKYDTSAKQRTPSWCDRVLWRSTVVVQAPEDKLGTIEESRTSRMSTAISHALLLPQLRQATLRREERQDSVPSVTFAPAPPVPERKPSLRPVAGEPLTDSPGTERPPSLLKGSTAVSAPSPRRWWNKRADRMPRTRTLDGTSKTRGAAMATAMGRAASAVDLPSQLQRRASTEDSEPHGRPSISARRSSIGQAARPSASAPDAAAPAALPLRSLLRGETSPEGISPGTTSSSSPAQRSFFRTASSDAAAIPTASALTPSSAATLHPAPAGNRRTSWWADHIGVHLPSFSRSGFTPFALLRANEAPVPAEPEPELVGPKRGEVEILLYTALDDR